jgi:hypothetical protein
MSATDAAVAAHRDQQRRRAPAQRLVCEFSGHRVARYALAAATPTPLIGLEDPAGKHGTVGLEPLAGDLEAELVEAAERGQVRAGEGSVRQVEVFQMASVRTSIIGRPRRLPSHRPHLGRYTVICEEPRIGRASGKPASLVARAAVREPTARGPGRCAQSFERSVARSTMTRSQPFHSLDIARGAGRWSIRQAHPSPATAIGGNRCELASM